MSSSKGIKVVMGSAPFGNEGTKFESISDVKKALDILKSAGVTNLDSAQLYGNSEKALGEAHAGADGFTIDTKWKGGFDPTNKPTKDHIISTAKESLERLQIKRVDIFYIHAPAHETPLEDTLAGVNQAYKSGAFTRFGLSNYKAGDVRKVYETCQANGYVLPTAYQGNYSPVARLQDELLFPTLRELGIAFYAYSPLAGGFLTKTKEDIENRKGRFDTSTMLGEMYSGMYAAKGSYMAALEEWAEAAEKQGCSKAELAYRWVAFNSPLKEEYGDAIIVGASSLQQLEQTVNGVKNGPLKEEVCGLIDKIWEKIKHEAPLDNYHR